MMTRMFWNKIGRMVEVYIDGMVVKSNKRSGIQRTFRGCLKYYGNINCTLMLISVLLGWGLASSLDT